VDVKKNNSKSDYFCLSVLDRICLVQVSEQGQLFCEFSASKLRELQSAYRNFTSPCTGSSDPDSNGQCYITPKLQKLLSVLKEDRNSKYGANELQLAFFFNSNF